MTAANSDEDIVLNDLFCNKMNNTNKFERDKGMDLIKSLLVGNEKNLEKFRDKILDFIKSDQQSWTFKFDFNLYIINWLTFKVT
jgi:hypothetical protein